MSYELVQVGAWCRKCDGRAFPISDFRIEEVDNIDTVTTRKTHLRCGDTVELTSRKIRPELWFVKFECGCFLPVEKSHCPKFCRIHHVSVKEKFSSNYDYDSLRIGFDEA